MICIETIKALMAVAGNAKSIYTVYSGSGCYSVLSKTEHIFEVLAWSVKSGDAKERLDRSARMLLDDDSIGAIYKSIDSFKVKVDNDLKRVLFYLNLDDKTKLTKGQKDELENIATHDFNDNAISELAHDNCDEYAQADMEHINRIKEVVCSMHSSKEDMHSVVDRIEELASSCQEKLKAKESEVRLPPTMHRP